MNWKNLLFLREKSMAIEFTHAGADKCLIWALSNGVLDIWATVWVTTAWPLCNSSVGYSKLDDYTALPEYENRLKFETLHAGGNK